MKPAAKYRSLDEQVLSLLRHGPATPFRLSQGLHVDADVARVVLRRLRAAGDIQWEQESVGARLKPCHTARKDPSPFPRPGHDVPEVGWFG